METFNVGIERIFSSELISVEQLIFEFITILPISVGIGLIASMTGISGGAFKVPALIILFALTAELASAASLLSAMFVAITSSFGYYRQRPMPINLRIGLLLIIVTIPGTYTGIVIRTIIEEAHLLRMTFGILLFPIALKLLLALPYDLDRATGESKTAGFSQLSIKRLILSVMATFMAGVSAGLLGLGGGTIIVPVLCILLNFPILAAAATSMFTMIFTSAAGSLMNYYVFIQTEDMFAFLFYGLAMGAGMIIGGIIGPKYASKVDGRKLQRFFAFILVFPIVKMMTLGQLWLDPSSSNYLMATIGDIIIWLVIGVPLWVITSHRIKSRQEGSDQNYTGEVVLID